MAKKYLSLEEACDKLGVSNDQLMKARENGEIRGFADRGSWKFREADVDEYARSQQADSDPDVQLGGDSVLEGDFDPTTSDSDVRLSIDDSLLPDLGESTSDVRLAGDSGPALDNSDSDVQLVGSDSDSDVRMMDSDSDVRLSEDSDSDVDLVTESDSDVKLLDDGSDSDVQLIEGLDATDGEIALSGSSDSIELEVVGDIAGADDSSLIMSREGTDSGFFSAMAADSSSVLSDPDDPGSDITLETPDSQSVLDDDDSGITLETVDSGVLLGADDSGISLESVDSGLVLDDESGISLDAGDSGISLDFGADDSGIALDMGGDDSGIALESDALDQTMPLVPSAGGAVSDELDTTMMESPDVLADSGTDSEFELAGLGGDDDDDVGMDTSVLLFEDDDEDAGSGGVAAVAGAAAGAVAAGSDTGVDFEDDDFADDDEFGMDDDFDDDVFDAADDDFDDDDFDAGESQVTGASGATAAVAPAVEHNWGVGWLVTLSLSSVLVVACCLVSFDLVRSMWSWNEPTTVSSTVMEKLGGMF